MKSSKIRAIIIDDELEGRYVLQSMLTRLTDVDVVAVAEDAESGLELIVKLAPDIIFLDIRMPRMSGLDLVKKLAEKQINTTIVFVTAYDKFGIQAIKLAAFDYLLKPINPDEIQRVIERFKLEKSWLTSGDLK